MHLVSFGTEVATCFETIRDPVSNFALDFPDLGGICLRSPPVQVTQGHIPTGINESEYLFVDVLSPYFHLLQCTVPSAVAVVQHLTYSIYCFLHRKTLSSEKKDQIMINSQCLKNGSASTVLDMCCLANLPDLFCMIEYH